MKSFLQTFRRRLAIRHNLLRITQLTMHAALAPLHQLPIAIPGAQVFIVGGSVRDFLLGGHAKDFDLCITGTTPQKVQNFLLSNPGAKAVFAGATFPVFKFRAHPEAQELDVALARTERSTGGGSLQDFETISDPSVTIQQDLSRRDFTWNAIAVNLQTATIVDPFDGLTDLKNGIVRTVGNPHHRFTEDRTRALRALRFAAKLDFTIHPQTWQAILDFAPRMNETSASSPHSTHNDTSANYILKRELAGREFLKSLDANPVRTMELWDDSGMFATLMPEASAMKGVMQRPDYHPEGDNFVHTKLALASLSKDASITLKLAVFFHDFGKVTKFQVFDRATKKQIPLTVSPREFCNTEYNPNIHLIKNIDHETDSALMAEEIIRRLALTASGIDADQVTYIVREHMFHGLEQWKLSKIEKILFTKNGEPIWDLYHMACADACGSHKNMDYAKTIKRYINQLLNLRAAKAKQPPKLLDGTIIMEHFNLSPGPHLKKLLELVREEQLNALAKGTAYSQDDALATVALELQKNPPPVTRERS